MEAFEKINDNLGKYFSKLTGGGNATLKLENPEEPFSGGIDMLVQFPRKPFIVVSGASGGERSVAAVAFIFAIKDFTPASFYILDEIDAHLDAFHVSRLADLLLEEAEKVKTCRPLVGRGGENSVHSYHFKAGNGEQGSKSVWCLWT